MTLEELRNLRSGRSVNSIQNAPTTESTGNACSSCGTGIDEKVATFSQNRYGRKLCRNCQKSASPAGSTSSGKTCSNCGTAIDDKVAAYSESHFGRALCLNCQRSGNQPAASNDAASQPMSSSNVCTACGVAIDDKVAAYSVTRFSKKLCLKCQRSGNASHQNSQKPSEQPQKPTQLSPAKSETPTAVNAAPAQETAPAAPACCKCGKPVGPKAVKYCEENSKDGKKYCSSCIRELLQRKADREAKAKAAAPNNAAVEPTPTVKSEPATDVPVENTEKTVMQYKCFRCGAAVAEDYAKATVTKYGKCVCPSCVAEAKKLKAAAKETAAVKPENAEPSPSTEREKIHCVKCNGIVDNEAQDYSRRNSKDGKMYCSACIQNFIKRKNEREKQKRELSPEPPHDANAEVERRGSVKDMLEDSYYSPNILRNGHLDFTQDNEFPYRDL